MDKVICTECGDITETPNASSRITNGNNCECGGSLQIHVTEQELQSQREEYKKLTKKGKEVADRWRKMMERSIKKGR